MSEKNSVLPIMLGTAGHVDHGKTSLVRALTNFETDTHKEEQERGVSIDFGVAPLRLSDKSVCGIIDVPGHIDYIRNMVAGATAIDLLLLVVAADDGVMPQTLEHLQIASLLGVKRLRCVLTKCDLVDGETIELACLELREFLEEQGYTDTVIHQVSSQTGEGIEELRQALIQEVKLTPKLEEQRPFRMFVRKAFTMKGFGTVVTGVPLSGKVDKSEELTLIPGGQSFGIRSIHNYRQEVNCAQTHISCALNLRDAAPQQFKRGMALVAKDSFAPMRNLLVSFKNVSDFEIGGTKKEQVVRLHVGTAAVPARVFGTVQKASKGFIQLRTYRPVVVAPGDHLLVRTLSTSQTIGGGVLLACIEDKKGALLNERNKECLEKFEEGDLIKACSLSSISPVITPAKLASYAQISKEQAGSELKKASTKGDFVALGSECYLVLARLNELAKQIEQVVKRYHRGNSESLGIHDQHLCRLLGVPENSFGKVWQHLQKIGSLRLEKGFVSDINFSPSISKKELELERKLHTLLQSVEGLAIAKGNLQSELAMPEKEFRKLLKRLSDRGLISVIGSSVMDRNRLESIQAKTLAMFENSPELELKAFRDALGLSRNVAVELLEHFDSRGITKRVGQVRILVKSQKSN